MFQRLRWYDPIFTIAIAIFTFARMGGYYNSIQWLITYFKPFPIFIMIAWLATCAKSPRAIWMFLIGLCFAVAGDILLLINGSIFFYLGGLCFTISNILYLWAFIETSGISRETFQNRTPFYIIFAIICIIIITVVAVNLSVIWGYLTTMPKIALSLYLGIQAVMIFGAFSRYYGVALSTYVLACVGVLFFFVSDLLLLQQRFNQKFLTGVDEGKIRLNVITFQMFCYYFGEYLIAASAVSLSRQNDI